jgi:spore germination cell wall hydrolase CwlJ-like protein
MSIKLNVASGIAVAATLLTALASTGGSGAKAEVASPVIVPESITSQLPATGIEALASVATVPPAPAPELPATPASAPRAASLAAHVKAQPVAGSLDRDLRCLAGAIYFESRGESLDGQLAVGRVVVERANSGRFPRSYCGVVFQPSQFSFVRGRAMPSIPEGSAAWQRAVAIARIAHEDSWDSPADGALFFHATYVSPGWRKQRLARIDNHIFYR